MEPTTCSEIRESLIRRLSEEIAVSVVQDQCVFSLPIRCLDNRATDVFVEKMLGDSYRIHDGGITTSHLFAQGIHITEHKAEQFEEIAKRLGASYMAGIFEVNCKESEIQDAIFAVGQCSALATFDLAMQKPIVEEDPIKSRVHRSLTHWKPAYVKQISQNVPVRGRKAKHSYDFVSFPQEPSKNTVAVQVLRPSNSPQGQARGYGFLVLDTEGIPPYETWSRLAIITKAENWGEKRMKLVRDLSHKTIELLTGEEEHVDKVIPQIMENLSRAA